MHVHPAGPAGREHHRGQDQGVYGEPYTGGVEFEARKRTKIDLTSFDTEIKVVKERIQYHGTQQA